MANYTAKSLEDISGIFDELARRCDKSASNAQTKTIEVECKAEARTWRDAADILRHTKLVQS